MYPPPTSLSAIGFKRHWLAQAAVAESSRLPLLSLGQQPSSWQLVLARYTNTFDFAEFNYKKLEAHGAMWSDSLTELACETHYIAGFAFGKKCVGIQVVRIGLPAGYDRFVKGVGKPVHGARTESGWAHEYWVETDIPAGYFANIPVQWDAARNAFCQPADYTIPPEKPGLPASG